MRWLRGLAHGIRALFATRRVEDELDEEIRFHLERDIERNVRLGMDQGEARRRAYLRFGGVEVIKEQVRDESGVRWIKDLIQDAHYTIRGLRKAPVFTIAALLSLGVGIGVNTAIFSVVNGVLLRPLSHPEADQLYLVRIRWHDYSSPLSDADLLGLMEGRQHLASVAGIWFRSGGFTVATPDGPEVVRGAWVTDAITGVFGVSPIAGRSFVPEDELAVMISHRYWQTRLQGSRAAVGGTIELDGRAFSIVGVMPPGFSLTGHDEGDIWALGRLREPTRRGPFYIQAIARLRDGSTAELAEADLRSVELRVREGYPESARDWRYYMLALKQVVVGDARATLTLLFGAVACVLLIAVANVVNLLLARGSLRQREVALRSALGAGRGRLIRQLITESAVLGLLGALIGLALAAVAVDVLSVGASAILPRVNEVNIDGRVLGFALFLGLACGTIAGTVPALTLPWSRVGELLKEGGRGGTAGGSRGKARKLLVVAEFALAFSVLICAGLLIKSLVRLQTADLGIDEAGVVTFRLALPDDPYNEHSAFDNFLTILEQQLSALPGVSAVGFSTALPPDRLGLTNNYTVEGDEAGPGEPRLTAEWLLVTGSYFDALRIPLLRGRTFTPSDREGQPGVVVVNEAFVRKHFPQEDPLGKRLKSGSWSPEAPWLTVVGVVGDVTYQSGAAGGFNPTVYTAYRQNLAWHAPFVVMRARGDPESLVFQVRREVRALEPRTPLRNVATMKQLVRGSTAVERFRSTLFVLLAFVALVMAATGIYGVISCHVASRRRETAIRRALGARNVQVVGAVLRQALLLAALGVVVGGAAALLLTRALTAFLFEVSPTDATAFTGAALVLIAVAIVACLVPSVRASRVDPVTVLREE